MGPSEATKGTDIEIPTATVVAMSGQANEVETS